MLPVIRAAKEIDVIVVESWLSDVSILRRSNRNLDMRIELMLVHRVN